MFKKFTPAEHVGTQSQVKSSVSRGIKTAVAERYPDLPVDEIFPKKVPVIVAKCHNNVDTHNDITIVAIQGEPLFFQDRDGPFIPTLKMLHKYPSILPHLRVDRGAIKFVLSGANIMCPGLTSPGAGPNADVESGTPVAIMAEGKQHAVAIGMTTMSTKEIEEVNKGICIEMLHCVKDGLYNTDTI